MLDLCWNTELKKLDNKILRVSSLTKLYCSHCFSLAHPSPAVCDQRLPAVIKYLTDLQTEKGVELIIVPVAIIGQKYSGKTSIVISIQQVKRKRTLNNCCKPASKDADKLPDATSLLSWVYTVRFSAEFAGSRDNLSV